MTVSNSMFEMFEFFLSMPVKTKADIFINLHETEYSKSHLFMHRLRIGLSKLKCDLTPIHFTVKPKCEYNTVSLFNVYIRLI